MYSEYTSQGFNFSGCFAPGKILCNSCYDMHVSDTEVVVKLV